MELSADPPFMQRFPQEKCRSEGTAVRQEREQSNGAAWAGRPLWKAGKVIRARTKSQEIPVLLSGLATWNLT